MTTCWEKFTLFVKRNLLVIVPKIKRNLLDKGIGLSEEKGYRYVIGTVVSMSAMLLETHEMVKEWALKYTRDRELIEAETDRAIRDVALYLSEKFKGRHPK